MEADTRNRWRPVGARLASGGALEGDMHVEARALGERDQGFEVEAVDAPAHEIVQTRLRDAQAMAIWQPA